MKSKKRLRITIGSRKYLIPLRVIGMVFFAIILGGHFVYHKDQVSAQTAVFYPTSCLGGWKNVSEAEGMPDVSAGDKEKYTDENSASVFNTSAEMYCGEFKGEIPDDIFKKKVLVRLSWSSENPAVFSAPREENISPEENKILETHENTGSEIPEEIKQEPIPEEVLPAEEEKIPAESTLSPESESPTDNAIIKLFTRVAHAEDEVRSEELIPSETILEVLYTIDGMVWNHLAYVKTIENDSSFELPTELFETAEDLKNTQIALRTVSTFDDVPKIYVDSVWLEVEYEHVRETPKGITDFKIFVLPFERLEFEVNEWLSTQKNILIDDIKIEDYGGGGYLIVVSYHKGGFGTTSTRLKLFSGETPQIDAQKFLSSRSSSETVRSVTAVAGTYSNSETTITVPLIFIVYE